MPERLAARQHGELVVVTIGGQDYTLNQNQAHALASTIILWGELIQDAATRAGGIEPRSGEPT
jgi:hypothetical protein